jgi:UDP-N-acetylmuramate: L-alanyl-gamma-D-glutamyl-meso-diaminopimelate ligase
MSTQLEKLGIPIYSGYNAANLDPKPQLVIVGNVITKMNPEAQALLASGIAYTSLPKAMGEFVIGDRESIVVAGTHGKTTTTALMAWIAQTAGMGAGFMIGGVPKNLDRSFQLAERGFFIIEGDEYDTAFFDKVPKFIHYRPRHVILTSIEYDHADIYPNIEAVCAAFQRLVSLIPRQGTLIAKAGDERIAALLVNCPAQKIRTYGLAEGDIQARNIVTVADGTEFDIFKYGAKIERMKIKLFGDYNVLNVTAAYALATELAWPGEKIRRAIASFEGVKRRQEVLGEPGGVLVIEDFAHHPTAVKATLESMHERFPGRKLFAVFEPRSATSRRKVFQQEYVEALKGPHVVLIPPAYNQEKIDPNDRFSVDELIHDLKAQDTDAHQLKGVDAIVKYIGKNSHAGDVVLIMSNGGFDGIYQKLLNALQ